MYRSVAVSQFSGSGGAAAAKTLCESSCANDVLCSAAQLNWYKSTDRGASCILFSDVRIVADAGDKFCRDSSHDTCFMKNSCQTTEQAGHKMAPCTDFPVIRCDAGTSGACAPVKPPGVFRAVKYEGLYAACAEPVYNAARNTFLCQEGAGALQCSDVASWTHLQPTAASAPTPAQTPTPAPAACSDKCAGCARNPDNYCDNEGATIVGEACCATCRAKAEA